MEDAEFAVIQLAQTTMRSELGAYNDLICPSLMFWSTLCLGKIKLDRVFQERTHLNVSIVGEYTTILEIMDGHWTFSNLRIFAFDWTKISKQTFLNLLSKLRNHQSSTLLLKAAVRMLLS